MNDWFDPGTWVLHWKNLELFWMERVMTTASLVQVAIISGIFLLAYLVSPWLRAQLLQLRERSGDVSNFGRLWDALSELVITLSWLLMQWLTIAIANSFDWSHSHNFVRLRIPVGISYRADPRQAIALCIEAAQTVPRVLMDPEPRCLLLGFGDSALNLELRIWIGDAENGRGAVIHEVLLEIWDRFEEHGVEIPFPQRDLHIKGMQPAQGTFSPPDPTSSQAE